MTYSLKKFRSKYRWYCNTTSRWVSPSMTASQALVANMVGDRCQHSTILNRFNLDPRDPTLILNWDQALRLASIYLQDHDYVKQHYFDDLCDFYGFDFINRFAFLNY